MKRDDIQLPWSRTGWWADEIHKEEDTDVYRAVDGADGRIRARMPRHRPGAVIAVGTNNPYLNLPIVAGSVWLCVFLVGKIPELVWVWVPVVVFFGLISLFILVMSVIRIPVWHRARKIAREHIAEHGGEFPKDLRWFM
ncbi:hypothetical protein [Homoserinibacter sp. GY 40078]|uniref:hypothetical protein n=1 Tax=Homoserinibacter sp. GY 40078 TaxID=2603275 RepID=UPI0011C99E5C|nr:hypothetical protein [Homoserinibacter sp. GY 40078]TXK18757.1 hypothetical protein FVQ89_02105 [Homoserinibacter sp. GY 40078]